MTQKGTTGKRRIPMTVTFLAMNANPFCPAATTQQGALLKCESRPRIFIALYDTIGEGYYWVDRG